MMNSNVQSGRLRPVRELSGAVARKIAAGEVIDRPAAVIRELLDNAIDAGASRIEVEIDSGGIERIRVRDNGCGMTRDDLELCTKTHTTSKISSEDDLLTLSTLGFRGEALSSIRAVSSLEIMTARDGHSWKLDDRGISPDRLPEGTVMELRGLFANFPARRQFLRKPSSEAALCRQIFMEKALPWPEITFRYTSGTSQPFMLPAVESLRERVLSAFDPPEGESFFHALETEGEGFTATIVAGTTAVTRANRKNIMIFVNGRRIQEYGLVQALEYGAEGYFPNGTHPFAILFVTMDSSLVDFNIHPAKREARFRDLPALHHATSSLMRNFFRNNAIAGTVRTAPEQHRELFPSERQDTNRLPDSSRPRFTRDSFARYDEVSGQNDTTATLAREALSGPGWNTDTKNEPSASTFRYLGQVLGTFLVVETDSSLMLIDQHAAHERILFNAMKDSRTPVQELLVPYNIETSSREEDRILEQYGASLAQAGFVLEPAGSGCWQVTAVPSRWTGTAEDLKKDILETGREPGDLITHLLARAACRAACKDGDLLDPATARKLVEQTLALEEPVCPHGRPVWTKLTRKELFERVQRT